MSSFLLTWFIFTPLDVPLCIFSLFFEFKALIFAHQFKFVQALVLQKDERKINGLSKE